MTNNSISDPQLKHPKGLFLLCGVEMWERFSYYGMRALLILYLVRSVQDEGMGMDLAGASLLYGFFTGFVYFTPLIGGWVADKWLGRPFSIMIGAILMAVGLFAMSFRSDWFWLSFGLILLVIGNGMFKPNISTLVGELYPPGDRRKDVAFTYFYMGINLGALIAPFVTAMAALSFGYRMGFFAAGIGLLIGLAIFIAGYKTGIINPSPEAQQMLDEKRENEKKGEKTPLTKEEKDRLSVIFIVVAFVTFFWAGFEQAGSSFTVFADRMVDRSIGTFVIPTEWFQSLNPIFVVMLAPVFASLWKMLGNYGAEPSIPAKMGIGMLLLSIGFVLLWVATLDGKNLNIHLLWLVGAYLLHTMGELALSPIGLSMVSKLSPARLASFMMGVWLLSSAVANILGGYIASQMTSLGVHTVFGVIASATAILGGILLSMRKWLERRMHGVS